MKTPWWFTLCCVVGIAFWAVAIYVVAHFVTKYW